MRPRGRRLKFIGKNADEARSTSPSWPRLSATLRTEESHRRHWVAVDETSSDQDRRRPLAHVLARRANEARRDAGRPAEPVEV